MKVTELDLQTIKKYCRINTDNSDVELEIFRKAAIDHISRYTGKNLETLPVDEIPYDYTIAALALISHWNENRSTTTEERLNDIPNNFEKLLDLTSVNF